MVCKQSRSRGYFFFLNIIEGPLRRKEREQLCIGVKGFHFASFYYMHFDFGVVPTMWYVLFLFFLHFIITDKHAVYFEMSHLPRWLIKRVKHMSRDTQCNV